MKATGKVPPLPATEDMSVEEQVRILTEQLQMVIDAHNALVADVVEVSRIRTQTTRTRESMLGS